MKLHKDPKHKSGLLTKWFEDNGIEVMDWPSQNPDANPIENAWKILKRRVKARYPKNKADLWKYSQEEWAKIPTEYFQTLAYSFPTRWQKIVAAKGHAVDY